MAQFSIAVCYIVINMNKLYTARAKHPGTIIPVAYMLSPKSARHV